MRIFHHSLTPHVLYQLNTQCFFIPQLCLATSLIVRDVNAIMDSNSKIDSISTILNNQFIIMQYSSNIYGVTSLRILFMTVNVNFR